MYFGGVNPGTYNVKASAVDYLVTASSRSYILFDNLLFTGSNTRTFMLTSSNNIQITNCDITFSGQDAIWVNASSNLTIENSTIAYTNNNAITGNNSTSFIIRGNNISNTGVVPGMGVSGDGQYQATAYIGGNSLIELNTITNTGYVGIHFVGVNTTIQKNFVDNFCRVKDDGGGIYSWNSGQSGSKVFNNIVVNGFGNPAGTTDTKGAAFGIYMDDNVNGVEIAGNTCAFNAYSGLYLHNANNLNIHNNTFYNNGTVAYSGGQAYYSNGAGTMANITLTNNIFFSRKSIQDVTNVDPSGAGNVPWFANANNNYYCRPLSENSSFSIHVSSGFLHTNLAGWKTQTGQESNSKITPIAITDTNKIRFEYNATNSSKVVALGANYMDVSGTAYNGTITLGPFSSAVLMQTTGSVNQPPVANAGADQIITSPTNVYYPIGVGLMLDGSITYLQLDKNFWAGSFYYFIRQSMHRPLLIILTRVFINSSYRLLITQELPLLI